MVAELEGFTKACLGQILSWTAIAATADSGEVPKAERAEDRIAVSYAIIGQVYSRWWFADRPMELE